VHQTAPAEELYSSPLYKAGWAWAKASGEAALILSAKHGILQPRKLVEPYDTYLGELNQQELEALAKGVGSALSKFEADEIIVLGGAKYVALVKQAMPNAHVVDPLQGLNIGNRIRWLKQTAGPKWRSFLDLELLYDGLRTLSGGQLAPTALPTLAAVLGEKIPNRGVYFFFEDGELRRGRRELRVTRVGTHAVSRGAASTLRGRLRTHAGTEALTGSHRSSIFRLHVGDALLRKSSTVVESWGTDSGKVASAETRELESEMEVLVSRQLRSMRVLILEVADTPSAQSDRAYVERNAIGLLSHFGRIVDPPSSTWLGLNSKRTEIATSGLWNLDHLTYQPQEQFPVTLQRLIAGKIPAGDSVAPANWWEKSASLF
jgi:hypothetical protein